MPYAGIAFKSEMRYENDSLISTYIPTYQTYGLSTTDTIFPIFPLSSAIPAASDESNPSR